MKVKDQIRMGHGGNVTRRCGDQIGEGILTPVRDGAPIPEGAELVRIEAPDEDGWHDIETIYRHERRATSDGPAQVATPKYREGHDRIFGKKPAVGLA